MRVSSTQLKLLKLLKLLIFFSQRIPSLGQLLDENSFNNDKYAIGHDYPYEFRHKYSPLAPVFSRSCGIAISNFVGPAIISRTERCLYSPLGKGVCRPCYCDNFIAPHSELCQCVGVCIVCKQVY